MSPLDCETCDSLLIDLVERELDEARAAEVRAHADGCESCGRALVRLEGGRRAARELVRAEPPRLDAVMAAARAHAAEVRAAAATDGDPGREAPALGGPARAPETPWLDSVVRWLGSWATRPQVAMAALLVLMIGIGVFNLPQFRARDGASTDGALVEPDVRAELGPSALDPAAPLQLDVDPRTQRVALGTGEHVEDEDPSRDVRPTTTIAAPPDSPAAPPPSALAHAPARAETPASEVAQDTTAPEALAVTDVAPSDGIGRVEDGPLPELAAGTEQTAVVLAPPTPGAPAPSAGLGSTHRAPTTPRTAPSSDEVEPPSASPVGMLPAAIHRQARSLASGGHCDQAVPRYRTLLAEHPDYADAPVAMMELAECDRRLGRLDEADRWLARAEAFPSVSADARRARTRIAVEQRAVDRASSPSAAPSSTSERATAAPPDTASAY